MQVSDTILDHLSSCRMIDYRKLLFDVRGRVLFMKDILFEKINYLCKLIIHRICLEVTLLTT